MIWRLPVDFPTPKGEGRCEASSYVTLLTQLFFMSFLIQNSATSGRPDSKKMYSIRQLCTIFVIMYGF
jgi:hypothetical protein